ncbi:B-cell receptor CD22-like [Sinocyclocheilus anshuiensis]|uniref:B-cell receptor CD22-like n=1 Tax=Sinocyclocheilus anshuiensis TaxID=1608454 RepID=UPI0007B8287B|nr:PREDICTED: B-cell receptor CD22-like [Sinocyclocheilus anshuiensis]
MMEVLVKFLLTGSLIQGVLCGYNINLPKKVEALKGSCVFIPCTFDINQQLKNYLTDSAKRMWFKDGRSTAVFDSSRPNNGLLKGEIFGTATEKNCTTRFDNVDQSHDGSYYFRLEANGVLKYNYKEPTHSQIQITVLGSPLKPTLSIFPDQQETTEGSSVSLRCSTKIFCPSRPPSLTWSSSLIESVTGQQYQSQTELISDLNFTVSHRHHRVTFTCTATHQLQQQSTTQESRLLRVQYAPKNTSVRINPAGLVLEGRSVTLSCSSDANPAVNYTWYRDTERPLNPVQTGSNLTINNTGPTHSGRYYCTAENKHGTQNSSVLLDVQYAPKNTSVRINPAGLVLEGRSVTLICSSDANPAVNYTWYRDTERPLNPVQTGPNLTINNTGPTHSGRYYCTAENKHGTQNTSVLLDVQYAPKNTSLSAFTSSSVMEGDPVTLSCSTDANPAELNYTWYTETGSQFELLQTGHNHTYIVTNPTYGARYGCKAQNQHGQCNATIQLDVQFAPKISSSCSRSSVMACVCEAHGNPCPTLEWRLSGHVLANSTETSISEETLGSTGVKSVLTIHQSLTDTDVLQCFSTNKHGSGSQQFQAVPLPQDTREKHNNSFI